MVVTALAWAGITLTAVATIGGVLLPFRGAIAALAIAILLAALPPSCLLLGSRAIVAIAWNTTGEWRVYCRRPRGWQSATIKVSTAQWGANWVWFAVDTAVGVRAVLIDRAAVADEAFTALIWALRAHRSRTAPAGG